MEISKKQMEMMLQMSYIANWITSDSEILSEAQMQEFEKFAEHLCNTANRMWYGDLLNKSTGDISEKILWKCDELIEEYNEYNFWEELKNRLTEKDFNQEHKKNWSKPISVAEKNVKMIAFEEKREEEFEEYGINRLGITK